MLFMKSQSIKKTQHLVYGTAQRQIIDELVADHSFSVDQKKAAISDPFIFFQHLVSPSNCLVNVGHNGIRNSLNAPFDFGRIEPGGMGKIAVDGASHKLCIAVVKFLHFLLKCMQFSGTDEGEI